MKTCNTCGIEKSLDCFSTKGWNKAKTEKRVNGRCKECHKAYMGKHYAENKDHILAACKEYREDPSNNVKAKKKAYSDSKRGKALQKSRAKRHYEANKQDYIDRATAWGKENPEYIRERAAKYRHENRERCRQQVRKRRSGAGSFSTPKWKSRLEYYGERCVYCGSAERIEIEHRIPLSRGGTNQPANLVPACKSCNCSKGTLTEREYLCKLGKTLSTP